MGCEFTIGTKYPLFAEERDIDEKIFIKNTTLIQQITEMVNSFQKIKFKMQYNITYFTGSAYLIGGSHHLKSYANGI